MSDANGAPAPDSRVRRWEAPEYESGTSGPLTAGRAVAIEERAHAEGYERGLEEGRREGLARVTEQAERLAGLFEVIEPKAAVLDETLLTQLGELVLVIAGQLIRRELNRDPGEVVAAVREGLDALPVSETEIRILLHPEDAALVSESLGSDAVAHAIRIVEDVTVSRGGARIDTDVSVVDATVEARLGAIAASAFGDEREPGSEVHER